MDEQKREVLEALRTQSLGVISTIDGDGFAPESAVVAVSETEDLELIFGTSNETRKYRNVLANPRVSFVIGWDDFTIQYEGFAYEAQVKEVEVLRSIHLAKNPGSKKYADDPLQRYFKVVPVWIRYTDHTQDLDRVFEIEFSKHSSE